LLVPVIARAGLQFQTVQGGCDPFIAEIARHLPHDIDCICTRASPMFAQAVLLHPQLGVLASDPVNQQLDLLLILINIGNDLADEDADDPLL
jgi:hypothetical protein